MSTQKKMRTKTNGAASEHSLAIVIRDSANQIWLAGLGAYAKAGEEGTRMFDSLVALGERVESSAREQVFRPLRAAENKAGEVRESASGTLGRLQLVFERRVAKILNALQIPTSRDVDELSQRVEELTVALDRMERRAAPSRSKTGTRASKTATKTASAKTRAKRAAGSTRRPRTRAATRRASAAKSAGASRAQG